MVRYPRKTVTLTVFNVDTKISGCYPRKEVNLATSYIVDGCQFSPAYKMGVWDGREKLLAKGVFPTGLLSQVEKVLKDNNVKYEIEDRRLIPPPASRSAQLSVSLREYQEEVVQEAIDKSRGVIWLATGGGKTEIAGAITKSLGLPTLFLVHRTNLLTQTVQRFKDRLGCNIGMIGSGKWEPATITVATVQTLASRLADKKHAKKTKEFLQGIDVLFLDECHLATAKTWIEVAKNCFAGYRFGLSGTPTVEGRGMWLVGLTGPVISKVSYEELIKGEHLVPPVITFVGVSTPKLPKNLEYQEVYDIGICTNAYRNKVIVELAAELVACQKPTLILVWKVSHGELISSMLTDFGIQNVFLQGGTSTEARDEAIKNMKLGNQQVIVATSIFDEGLDIPSIQAVVLAGGGKSWSKLLQRVGRGVRRDDAAGKTKVEIFDFADSTHKYLVEHSLERLGIYRDQGFEVQNIVF